MTTTSTTCNMTVARGVGRKKRFEFCGRDAAFTVTSAPMNLLCTMHVKTNKTYARANRAGLLSPVTVS